MIITKAKDILSLDKDTIFGGREEYHLKIVLVVGKNIYQFPCNPNTLTGKGMVFSTIEECKRFFEKINCKCQAYQNGIKRDEIKLMLTPLIDSDLFYGLFKMCGNDLNKLLDIYERHKDEKC